MRTTTLATLAFAAFTAASPAGVSQAVAPSSGPPPGCSENYAGTFQIEVVNVSSTAKRDLEQRDTPLTITLKGGVLTDSEGRTGYVAANQQFQFDKPPQAGAIYTSGFSICANKSMAIGNDAVWYSCLSGTFYNLYDSSSGAQCFPVYIEAVGSGAPAPTAAPPASPPASPPAPPATSAPPATTAPPASSVAAESPDGQVTATPVPPPAVCSEYVDGQPQCSSAPAAPVCSEYVDGQPQCSSAPAAPVCSEYVDGQPQCSSASAAPVCSEYVDGQPQCATGSAVPAYGTTGGAPAPSYTGPAIASGLAVPFGVQKEMFGLAAAGVFAVALL